MYSATSKAQQPDRGHGQAQTFSPSREAPFAFYCIRAVIVFVVASDTPAECSSSRKPTQSLVGLR